MLPWYHGLWVSYLDCSFFLSSRGDTCSFRSQYHSQCRHELDNYSRVDIRCHIYLLYSLLKDSIKVILVLVKSPNLSKKNYFRFLLENHQMYVFPTWQKYTRVKSFTCVKLNCGVFPHNEQWWKNNETLFNHFRIPRHVNRLPHYVVLWSFR